jgi:hypothetical protein
LVAAERAPPAGSEFLLPGSLVGALSPAGIAIDEADCPWLTCFIKVRTAPSVASRFGIFAVVAGLAFHR